VNTSARFILDSDLAEHNSSTFKSYPVAMHPNPSTIGRHSKYPPANPVI
jgi:hypothetical protein